MWIIVGRSATAVTFDACTAWQKPSGSNRRDPRKA